MGCVCVSLWTGWIIRIFWHAALIPPVAIEFPLASPGMLVTAALPQQRPSLTSGSVGEISTECAGRPFCTIFHSARSMLSQGYPPMSGQVAIQHGLFPIDRGA